MFGLGHMEIAIVLIVGVLLFGSQLPKVARNLGQAIPSFKKGIKEVESEVKELDRDLKSIERTIKD